MQVRNIARMSLLNIARSWITPEKNIYSSKYSMPYLGCLRHAFLTDLKIFGIRIGS